MFAVEVDPRAITDGLRVGWKTGAAVPARVVVLAGVHRVCPDALQAGKEEALLLEGTYLLHRISSRHINGSFRFRLVSLAFVML